MLLHQLGDDFILLGELLLKLGDLLLRLILGASAGAGLLEGALGLREQLPAPGVNQTGLNVQLVGQAGHGHLVGKPASDDIGLLLGREATTCAAVGLR